MFTHDYDGTGRLASSDPLGGFVQFGRTDATSGFSWTIAESTSMGRSSSYQSTAILPWTQDGTEPESEQHTNTGQKVCRLPRVAAWRARSEERRVGKEC